MPPFELSEKELQELAGFLKCVNASGNSDPRNFSVNSMGMTNAGRK